MTNIFPHSPLIGLASHLVHDGLLDAHMALQFQQEAKNQNISFIHFIVKNNILDSDAILQSCQKSFGLPIYDLHNYDKNRVNNTILNAELIRRFRFIPLKNKNNLLEVGISDPTDRQTLDSIAFYTKLRIIPYIVAENQLDHLIQLHFNEEENKNLELSLLKELAIDETPTTIQENSVSYDEPLIRFVDHIIQHALHKNASDIHIEPFETTCRIRYRQDGILYEIAEIPSNLATRLVTRLKVMAKLDIAERRLPQDGRFPLHQIDIRMNTCPTLFGEKIVLRLLDAKKNSLAIQELGLTDLQKNIFLKSISKPQGLILVTGPTGSGKTMTLYSALHYLNSSEKNISTVEDPVEIQLKGINQVNMNAKINLQFSNILKTFLRQDPDIIMIGEIRDTETAEIAIQAAQTGHLVLSTLHTNSAIETITRLQSMGIKSYNMMNSISLIIAQRLVRKLCNQCKQPETIPLNDMGFSSESNDFQHFRAAGCQHCLQGYQGRVGIYELLLITPTLGQLLLSNANNLAILTQAKQDNFITLREAGLEKVREGITSLAEINRLTQQ